MLLRVDEDIFVGNLGDVPYCPTSGRLLRGARADHSSTAATFRFKSGVTGQFAIAIIIYMFVLYILSMYGK